MGQKAYIARNKNGNLYIYIQKESRIKVLAFGVQTILIM